MTFSSLFPYLFVGLLIALAIGAGIMLLLGSKNASGAGWAVTILFFGVGALAVVALVLGFDGGGSLLSGQSAWVEPGGNLRTLSLGLHDEPMSWIWILASALVGLAFLASRDLHSGGRAPHRLYAALAVEMAACGLCWVSYSAWSALFACGLALAGGVILLGTHSGVSGEEARFAFRYALERFGALVMALLGVLTLAWHGVDLVPGAPAPSVGTGFPGGWILAVGAYLMVRPFPLLGWAESPSQVSPAGRILVAELLPGIAAYGLIHEAAPTLKQLGVFPLFGVVPLAGMALTMLAGLFQQDPSRALSCWLSAAFCAGLSALAWAGPTVSDPLLLGTLLGCAGFIVAVGSLERGSGGWASPTGMVAMAGAASATGMFGFLAAGGHFGALADAAADPARLAVTGVNYLILVYFFWKTVWETKCPDRARASGLWVVFPPLALVVCGLALIWTGSLSAGVLPEGSDRLGRSLMTWAAGGSEMRVSDVSGAAYWILVGSFVAGLLVSIWSRATWLRWAKTPPRVGRFLASGYGVDRMAAASVTGMGRFSIVSERFLNQTLWSDGISRGGFKVLDAASRAAIRVDRAAETAMSQFSRRLVQTLAKVLQVIQSGDFQWYLLFGVTCGAGILIHYLRVRN